MNKKMEWESNVNGQKYAFSYEKLKGKHVLTVNGFSTELKASFASTMLGFDEPFLLDGKEARLVINGNKPDVALDGTYLQSGKKYVKRPWWAILFAVICAVIPIVSLGGLFPILLGVGSASLCLSVSRSSLPTAGRVILCLLITLAAWAALVVLVLGVAALSMLQM